MSSSPTSSPSFFLQRAASLVAYCYLRLVGATSIVRVLSAPSYLPWRRAQASFIYAFWHNVQVPLAYAHRGAPAFVLVSKSQDGEYIAQVMKRLGIGAVRGSSSRGGESAFREMMTNLESGFQIGFTPDGPRGPLYSVSKGVVSAAQISQKPVVAVGAALSRKITFKSWDRFQLPLPFGVQVVVHSAPFYIEAAMDSGAAQEKVKAMLMAVERDAQEELCHQPSYWGVLAGELLFQVYRWGGFLLSPFLFLGLLVRYGFGRGLKEIPSRFGLVSVPKPTKKRLWFHSASVGEWQALKPLIQKLKNENVFELLITVSTPEALTLVRQQEPTLFCSFLPVDMMGVMSAWVKKVQPYAVGLVETELWMEWIQVLHHNRIPVFVVNGRLSEKSARGWSWVRPLAVRLMSQLSFVMARGPLDAKRYESLGVSPSRLMVTGNMKADNLVLSSADEKKEQRHNFFGDLNDVLLVAGSTWPGEEELLLQLFKQPTLPAWRLIVAPRRMERVAEVQEQLNKCSLPYSLWSEVKKNSSWTTKVLLVDTLGDLKKLYAAGDVAFVGGSVNPHGGQNPLEPASVGLPVAFGSSMENFLDEAAHLVKNKAALQSTSNSDLLKTLSLLISSISIRTAMGAQAAEAVLALKGATQKTADELLLRLQ